MELVSPGIGLIFWMTLAFGTLLLILGRFAWKPIMKSLTEREDSIDEALHQADKARQEMLDMKFSNVQLLAEAKEERDALLQQARVIKDKIIEEARESATAEANRIIESAHETIENDKKAALVDLRNQIAMLSIEIAEKVLQRELDSKEKQNAYADELIRKTSLN
ncbi:MAG: F0F1 ATP synthase subunit B [Bacteroidales bacterium]|nr:F0F1 ATP synthase subunit B [Bacteroidales bacterium]NCU34435.1 ATP synthase F0 subunit B [Candidatus Falkowbacteria bacterium]MDD2631496.1 F0F1 ATP synthase subunit B [Bacteroidales bacterium]MDD3131018.1 F0F1 ATP synthase subunit B [Bacteroidales bacterium]MDD3528012.1 F0F1 ATP synthase subunit B [Bacteroidales bacterium]